MFKVAASIKRPTTRLISIDRDLLNVGDTFFFFLQISIPSQKQATIKHN
jgi:hypothetical protein